MITPRFKLMQDEYHVFINIHAPFTNIGDTEIDVDGENFLFVSSPYFLRLRLPKRIVDNDSSKGSYTCDSGEFKLTFDKESPGECFENLDMITSLLTPRDIPNINPSLIEMLEEDGTTFENDDNKNCSNKFAYGFANKVSTEFSSIGVEFPQVFELRSPDHVPINDRYTLKEEYENDKFCSDHYLADLYDDDLIAPYLAYAPYWGSSDFKKNLDFSDDEVAILKELPNKHYLLNKNEYGQVLLGLVDILYGYCYDKRSTLNDSNIESCWTVNKLSGTLSWFCTFKDMKEVLTSCYRRSLIYPIYRNYKLCEKVKKDITSLIRNGKTFVIKCMIDIHQMFNASNDARYILNQLYIKDYLVFLQKCRHEELDELCNNIANIELCKVDLNLELGELESAAEMVKQDETDLVENDIAVGIQSMSLLPGLKKVNLIHLNETDSDDSFATNSSGASTYDSSSEFDSDDDP